MYTKVDSSLDFVERENNIREFWNKKNIFDKQTELRKDGDKFVFTTVRRQQMVSRISVMF